MINKVQNSKLIPYLNSGASDIKGGAIVIAGGVAGVAVADIPASGGQGIIDCDGVFTLEKGSAAVFSQGQAVYASGGVCTPTSSGGTRIGVAYGPAVSGGATVDVILNFGG